MLKLWGRTNSSNVMKVLWLLDELGLAYERVDAGLAYGRNDTAEYRRMSPFGLVPALEDDGFTLFESNAILRHICRVHAPSTPLYPDAPAALAVLDAWMDVQQTKFSALSRVFQTLIRTPAALRDDTALAAAIAETAATWAVVDTQLAGRRFLCGEAMTLADVAFGPNLHRWFAMPIERPDMANLRRWYERLLTRSAFVRHCAQPLS